MADHTVSMMQMVRIQSYTEIDFQLQEWKVGKVGNVDLYSVSLQMPLTRSDMDHTVLPTKNTISAFTRKHSPGGATMHMCIANT